MPWSTSLTPTAWPGERGAEINLLAIEAQVAATGDHDGAVVKTDSKLVRFTTKGKEPNVCNPSQSGTSIQAHRQSGLTDWTLGGTGGRWAERRVAELYPKPTTRKGRKFECFIH